MYSNTINSNINFKSGRDIKNIQKACEVLGTEMKRGRMQNTPIDVAEVNGKVFLSSKRLTDNSSALEVKIVHNNDEAYTLIAKGSFNYIKRFLTVNTKKTAQQIDRTIKLLASSLKKASNNEAKSLTDF